MQLPDTAALTALIQALAPGILILGIRRRFIVGPPPDLQTSAVTYAMVSAVYFAVAIPARTWAEGAWGAEPVWAYDLTTYFGAPIVLGSVLALVTVNRAFDRILKLLGFQPIHHIPTAWDWVFGGRMPESWIEITLGNGDRYAGIYGRGSFASSSDQERDLFISEVWDSSQTPWILVMPKRSLLLCGRDVQSVAFFGAVEREHVEQERKPWWQFWKRVHTRPGDRETPRGPSRAEPNDEHRATD